MYQNAAIDLTSIQSTHLIFSSFGQNKCGMQPLHVYNSVCFIHVDDYGAYLSDPLKQQVSTAVQGKGEGQGHDTSSGDMME